MKDTSKGQYGELQENRRLASINISYRCLISVAEEDTILYYATLLVLW